MLQDAQGHVVVLGKIRTAVGLAGWVKVQSYTEPVEKILAYSAWQLHRAGCWEAVQVVAGCVKSGVVQAQLAGYTNRDTAVLLRGLEIGVSRDMLPALQAGEYYLDDLLGMQVLTPKGQVLGRLECYVEHPVHLLMQIQGERQYWVPAVKQRILTVDLEHNQITVDWEQEW